MSCTLCLNVTASVPAKISHVYGTVSTQTNSEFLERRESIIGVFGDFPQLAIEYQGIQMGKSLQKSAEIDFSFFHAIHYYDNSYFFQ